MASLRAQTPRRGGRRPVVVLGVPALCLGLLAIGWRYGLLPSPLPQARPAAADAVVVITETTSHTLPPNVWDDPPGGERSGAAGFAADTPFSPLDDLAAAAAAGGPVPLAGVPVRVVGERDAPVWLVAYRLFDHDRLLAEAVAAGSPPRALAQARHAAWVRAKTRFGRIGRRPPLDLSAPVVPPAADPGEAEILLSVSGDPLILNDGDWATWTWVYGFPRLLKPQHAEDDRRVVMDALNAGRPIATWQVRAFGRRALAWGDER